MKTEEQELGSKSVSLDTLASFVCVMSQHYSSDHLKQRLALRLILHCS